MERQRKDPKRERDLKKARKKFCRHNWPGWPLLVGADKGEKILAVRLATDEEGRPLPRVRDVAIGLNDPVPDSRLAEVPEVLRGILS